MKHFQDYLKQWGAKGGVDRQVVAHVKIGEILWKQSCPLPDGGINGACIELKRERAGGAARVAEKQAKAQKGKKKGKNKGANLPPQCGPETKSKIIVHDRKPGPLKEAMTHFAEALKLFRGGAADKSVPGKDEAERTARTAQMAYYAAEARFRQGDVEYEKFLKLAIPDKLDFSPPPPDSSPGKAEGGEEEARGVNQKKFNAWFTGKGKQLDTAQKIYQSVIQMKQAHWVIAAAARIGQLYQDFSGQLYTAPVPKAGPAPAGYPQDEFEQLFHDAYCDAMVDSAEPLETKAIEGLSVCLNKSTDLSFYDEWSKLCEAELNQLKPVEYPIASEIRARAGLRATVAMDRESVQPLERSNERAQSLRCSRSSSPSRRWRAARRRDSRSPRATRTRQRPPRTRRRRSRRRARRSRRPSRSSRSRRWKGRRSRPAPRPSSTPPSRSGTRRRRPRAAWRRPTARGWRRTSRASREPGLAAQAHFNAGTHPRELRLRQGRRERVPGGAVGQPGVWAGDGQPRRALLQAEQPGDGEVVVRKGHRGRPGARRRGLRQPRRHRTTTQGKQTGDQRDSTRRRSRNLRRALAIDAYDVKAYSILALVYYTIAENDKSKLDLAELVCKQAQTRSRAARTTRRSTTRSGLIQLRKKNPSMALKQFEQAVALDPKYVDAHLNIGAIGLSTRQYEKAAAVVRGGAQARAEELGRDHGNGRGAARPQEDRRGGELVQEGGRARPARTARSSTTSASSTRTTSRTRTTPT